MTETIDGHQQNEQSECCETTIGKEIMNGKQKTCSSQIGNQTNNTNVKKQNFREKTYSARPPLLELNFIFGINNRFIFAENILIWTMDNRSFFMIFVCQYLFLPQWAHWHKITIGMESE